MVGRRPLSEGCSSGRDCLLSDRMPRGVTGNTSDSGSEESRFEPWRGNRGSDSQAGAEEENVEGWPSGLRRRPAKALTRKGLVGSNPTPSAFGNTFGVTRKSSLLDRWPSGLRRTPGERVGSKTVSWVRIPPCPLHWRQEWRRFLFGVWLSPVERCVRDAEVPGSNPGTPI